MLLLAAAVVFVVRTPQTALSEGRSDTGTSPTAASAGAGQATASPASPTTPTDTATAAPGAAESSDGTASGPGRTAAGIQLIGQPRSDGNWDVIEYVRLTSPATTLTLTAPAISRLGGQFSGLTAGRSSLQVSAGDQVASIEGSGSRQSIVAPSATQSFVLRYLLTGATVRSVPSTAGRALTALAPIADPGDDQTPVEIITSGSTVRTVQCPLLSGDQQLCQAGDAPAIRVAQPLPRASAIALVQFDLPAPS